MTLTAVARLPPSGVSRYSTVTGTVGYTVRVIRPSRSRPRRVWVSTFWSATDDPDAILLFEQWQERQALETHLAAPHTAAFLAQIGPAVDGTLEVTRFEVSDYGSLFGR
jgi:quinol monooxygenase YgiN